jgi:hypothetical protein
MHALALLVALAVLPQDKENSNPPVEELVKSLGADDFKTREDAQKKLEAMGPEVLPQLKKELEGAKDEEVRTRLNNVISKLEKGNEEPQAPARKAARKAPTAQEQVANAKKIVEQITKLLDDKDKSDEEKVKEMAKLSRELQRTLRAGNDIFEGLGNGGAQRVRMRVIHDGNGFRIEREDEEEGKKEEPPQQKTPKAEDPKKD